MIRGLFEEFPVFTWIAALLLLLSLFIGIDSILSVPEYHHGKVVDKQYKAETKSTGIGSGAAGNGQVGVVITSQNEPEKFLLMVKTPEGKVLTADAEAELYYQKEIGDNLAYALYKGRFTGFTWSVKGLK